MDLLHKQQEAEGQDEPGKEARIGEHPHMKIPERQEERTEAGGGEQPTESTNVTDQSRGPDKSSDPVATQAIPTKWDETNKAEHENVQAEIANGSNSLAAPSSNSKSSSRKSLTVAGIAKHLNAGAQDTTATLQDDDAGGESTGEFSPHIMHESHRPCPIAMVNRIPRGSKLADLLVVSHPHTYFIPLAPGHEDPYKVPQDVAFLGAFKYAQKNIFMWVEWLVAAIKH
jgi:hypothetical protein